MRFDFATATEIAFGAGSREILAERVRREGTRAFAVTGREPGRADALFVALEVAGVTVTTWPLANEPTVDDARLATRVAREEGADVVVGLGGGSAIDLAKAVAALVTNGGDPLDYLEVIGRGQPVIERALPVIAVPTTAGSGAEVTRNAVLTSPADGVKASLRSPMLLPRLAIVDPELTRTLPPSVTASTGMDALAQLLEPYVSARANPLTDAVCLEGLPRAARALRRAYADGNDLEARTDMSLAALFGGMALANSGLGAVHAFAAAIGGRFDAPHGAVCAALLPGVVRANVRALEARAAGSDTLDRYRTAGRILVGETGATFDELIAWLDRLCEDLRIPPLAAYGIDHGHARDIVTAASRASSMRANPVALGFEELQDVLLGAL